MTLLIVDQDAVCAWGKSALDILQCRCCRMTETKNELVASQRNDVDFRTWLYSVCVCVYFPFLNVSMHCTHAVWGNFCHVIIKISSVLILAAFGKLPAVALISLHK